MGSCCSSRNIKAQLPYFIEAVGKSSQSNDRIEIDKQQSDSKLVVQRVDEPANLRITSRSSSKLKNNVFSPSPEASVSYSSYLDISSKIQTKPRIRQLPSIPNLKIDKVKPIEPVIDDDVINRRKLAFQQQRMNKKLTMHNQNHPKSHVGSNELRQVKSYTPTSHLALPENSTLQIKKKETPSISSMESSVTISPSASELNSQRSLTLSSLKNEELITSYVSLSPLPTSSNHRNLLNRTKSKHIIPELRINSQPDGKIQLEIPKVPQLYLDMSMKWEASSEIYSHRNMNLLSPHSTASVASFSVRNILDRRTSNGSSSTTISPLNDLRLGIKGRKRRNLLELKPISSERTSSRPECTILSDSGSLKSNIQFKRTKVLKKSKGSDSYSCINQYKLKEELGKGAFGRVVKATTEDGGIYAIKIYNCRNLRSKWISKGQTALDLISTEIEIMSKLDHPNVIKLHEVIESPSSNKIYLIMDYASRGSLADIIPISESEAKKYFKHLICGLSYLHKVAKVAHKDIKPDNLLIDSENRLRIGDFGSSQNLIEGLIEIRGSVSTYAFMAPELVRGDLSISGEAVDVWASGVTLYYMILGQLPFHTKKLQQMYEAIKTQEVSFPNTLSSECVSLLSGMLEKDPSARIKVEEILRYSWMKH